MGTFISKVEDIFQISGRGCVVVPGIPKDGGFRLKVGDPLLLRRPDGTELSTTLRGIEMVEPRRGDRLSGNPDPVGARAEQGSGPNRN
jgi:translation elongation factor EF-Tu-like GTPase